MYRIEGKMFVWTYKGDVYLRKDAIGAPKIKINSEQDLNDIIEGKILLVNPPVSSAIADENVYYILSNENDSIEVITI